MSFRKIINIIIIAGFFVLLAIFIAQNNQAVSIRFMKWNYDSQSGLIVLFSFLAGGLVALFICVVSALFRKKPRKPEGIIPTGQKPEEMKVVSEKEEVRPEEPGEPQDTMEE